MVRGLHRKSEWNESHKVMPVSQDYDSSDGMSTKQVLIT